MNMWPAKSFAKLSRGCEKFRETFREFAGEREKFRETVSRRGPAKRFAETFRETFTSTSGERKREEVYQEQEEGVGERSTGGGASQ